MTITVKDARNELTANAGQTIFNYTFKIFSITDLNVYITPAGQAANDSTDLTTAFTVLGVGDEDGGTITLTVGANLNDLVTIVSNIPSLRTTDYQNNGDFRPDVVNDDFDRVVSLVKKAEDTANRGLALPQSQQGPKPLTLPNPSSGKVMTWKADLSGMENKEISELNNGLIASENINYAFKTVLEATSSTNSIIVFDGASVEIGELTTGNGGGAPWDVVLLSTVTPDGDGIIASTGIVTLAFVRRDDTRLEVRVNGIEADLSDVAISASDDAVSLTNPAAIVVVPSTDNKADPAVVDQPEAADNAPTPITSTSDQIHRLRNSALGETSAQSSSTLGTFAVSRKYDVTASTQFTVSIHGAPLGFIIYDVSFDVQEFDAAGEFIANIVGTVDANKRQMTFTTTTGVKIAFNIRNASDFSNSNPMTEAALDLCLNNIMMNLGSSSLPFVPFSDGNFTPTSALFDPEPAGQLQVSKQGTFYYIRAPAQQSTDKDLVWRILVNQGVNRDSVDSRTGVVDFYGIRFIDKTEVETRAAFNKSTLVHNSGIDESAPTRINDMFVAGGHGVVGSKATDVAHGKTNVDVGSIWSDGTDQWVIYFIDDVDNISLVRKNVGTTDKWIISTADFGSSTLTHVSGATSTTNIVIAASVQIQHIPIIRDHLAELRIDDVVITVDDDYTGQRVVVSETYALLNVGEQQAALIADVGNASPDYTNETTIGEQKRFYYEFEWNEFGAMSIRMAHSVKAPYRRSALVDYWGGIQLQRLSLAGDSTGGMHDKVFNYIPQIAPVSGLDFENIVEVTNNVLDVFPQASDCDDPNDPASHACLIGKNSADVVQSGHVFGYSRDEGLGVPATRAASTDTIFRLSPAEKNYIYGVDAKSGDASAGDLDTIAAFRAPFLPTDTTLTIPGVIVTMSGRTYCYITAHQNHTSKKVSIPSKYNGWPITVLKAHSNVTVNSEFVSTGEIDIDVINSYGDVVLRLGS